MCRGGAVPEVAHLGLVPLTLPLHKPVFVVRPSVPAHEAVNFEQIPTKTRDFLAKRQFFDFTDPAWYKEALEEFRGQLVKYNR